jgi:hypothetical protein
MKTGISPVVLFAAATFLAAPVPVHAQAGRGGRGGPPPAAKAIAPIDLTGYWVSEIVDEWRFRVTPQKGDYVYMPLNAEARKIADSWDPDQDAADGKPCKAYGAVGLMQRPGRLHITWQDDNTLKIEGDAGTQTRLLHFGPAPEQLPGPSWQGYSAAAWEGPGFGRGGRGGRGGGMPQAPRLGELKVVTNDMLPGYLRKNGVPYSDKAELTEYYNLLTGEQNDTYFVVTAMVTDPVYLAQPFIRTYQFKKIPDAAGWDPTPCLPR